jgi:hypothetical protein
VVERGRLRITLSDREIETRLQSEHFPVRVREVVSLVAERLSALAERDPQPDVVIIAMPKAVEAACGEGANERARRRRRTAAEIARQRDRERGQLLLFDEADSEQEPVDESRYRGFRNALKAHAMRSKLTTQLVWESTLDGSGGTQDPATTAWNFFTAIYYKAGLGAASCPARGPRSPAPHEALRPRLTRRRLEPDMCGSENSGPGFPGRR